MRFDRVIWDFNGTILDDVDTGIESADDPDIASRSAEIRIRVFVMGGAFMGRIVLRSFIRGFSAAEFHRRSRPAAIASRV